MNSGFFSLVRTRVTGTLSWGYQEVILSLQFNETGVRGICFVVTTCLKEKEKSAYQGVESFDKYFVRVSFSLIGPCNCKQISKFNRV